MAKKFFLLLWCFFVLVSCRIGNTVIAVSTITPIPSITSTVTSTITLTPTITNTPTVSADVMNYQCLDIADRPPSNYISKGTKVYNNADNTDAFLWNNDKKTTYKFPRKKGDRLLDFEVSPDRELIKYQIFSENTGEQQLVIATADGQPVWSKVINSFNWVWFDNERLISLVVPQTGSACLFLLNPFTGERQELRADYPDSKVFSRDWFPSWSFTKGGLPLYDPTLTRVVYPECNSECQGKLHNGESGWQIALRDLEKDEVIARIPTLDVYGKTPIWTPDGKQFILATKIGPAYGGPYANEFFSMSRDGQLKQLTHFTDYFKEIYIPDAYSLSPDGKQLAFWITAQPSLYEGPLLAAMNVETGEVTNYCIQGDPDGPFTPLWSPDGTQLLLSTPGKEDKASRGIVLVDLANNYAAHIGDDVIPVAWMVSQ